MSGYPEYPRATALRWGAALVVGALALTLYGLHLRRQRAAEWAWSPPLPPGAVAVVERRSRALRARTWRFTVTASPAAVADFYDRRLAGDGWRSVAVDRPARLALAQRWARGAWTVTLTGKVLDDTRLSVGLLLTDVPAPVHSTVSE